MHFVSKVNEMGAVSFPQFMGERHYMRKFNKRTGLPSDLKHWQNTVDQMLDGVDTDNDIFIMIDQGTVKAGSSHRRPGAHVDGYWIESISAHGGGHGSAPVGGHRGSGHRSSGGHISASGVCHDLPNWVHVDFSTPEGIILASDYSSCAGYIGNYSGTFQDGGSCEGMDLSELKKINLESNKVYIGNVGFVHESIPVEKDVQRTLVRLNVKNWEIN